MNETIMLVIFYSELCVVTQESQLSSGTTIPPLVTLAPRALLTLVRLTLSHSGGAAPHFGLESHYCLPLQREAKQK